MANLGLKPELRDGETIRAYFDELVLLKTPVQLWLPQSDAPPFETTIERISGGTFVTATTPPLVVGQQLFVSFLLEARRFNAPTRVVATGMFQIPDSVAQGERRERYRAVFAPADGIQVFAIERLADVFPAGRLLFGRLTDLSLQGMRVAIEELEGAATPGALKPGDAFEAVCIRGLPFTPDIRCRAVVAHVIRGAGGALGGFRLEGLERADQQNIERILARRFPTTFGQAFPRKKRKTDLGDRLGAPVPVPTPARAPEVVAQPAAEPPRERAPRGPSTPAMRLRKASRRILVISAGLEGGAALAEHLRRDDFRQVQVAGSFLEAKNVAGASRFDLLLLDLKVGGHFGQMILQALWQHGLLLDTPVILVGDPRDASLEGVAEEVGAVHVHDRRDAYERLAPVVYRLLGVE